MAPAKKEMESIFIKVFTCLDNQLIQSLALTLLSKIHDEYFKTDPDLPYPSFQTIEDTLLPEILTVVLMEQERLNYKQATLMLYEDNLPTIHHEAIMESVRSLIF